MRQIFSLAIATSIGIASSAMAATIYPANNGFEVNDLGSGAGAYEYGTVPGWTISGNPGEAANGSAFGVTGATNGNSDGTTSTAGQAALFQGGDGTLTGTAITQSVTIPRGPLTINFAAEERGCCSGTNNESLNVYLDGNLIHTVTSSQLSTGSFTSFSTPATAVLAAGAHTIGFAGLRRNRRYHRISRQR